MARDETFEEFSKWYLSKFPDAKAKDLQEDFNLRQRIRQGHRQLIREELIKYGLIDQNGKRPGVIYNGS